MSALELWDNYHPIKLLKMGVESPLSAKFSSIEVSNFSVSPVSAEPVDPCLLKVSWVPMIPQVGEAVVPTMRTGPFSRGYLTACWIFPGVVPFLHALLTCPGFNRMHALLCTASMMTCVHEESLHKLQPCPEYKNQSSLWWSGGSGWSIIFVANLLF